MKSKHATLLNALAEMQESPAYAARRGVLQQAEELIVRLERELDQLKSDADVSNSVHLGLKVNDTVTVNNGVRTLSGNNFSGQVGVITALGNGGGMLNVTVQFSDGSQLRCGPNEVTLVSREQ